MPVDPALRTVLSGRHVRLEPLETRHAQGLVEAGRDAAVWRWLISKPLESVAEAEAYIAKAHATAAAGTEQPFAAICAATGRVAGSTRYLAIRREHRGLEIGWTWLGLAYQRTAINTECKLLLLGNAFENWGAMRVELKTDINNTQSQRAIERIGGTREGVFRRHMVRRDGTLRDSVYYSIIGTEWPAAKARLEAALAR